MGEFVMPISVRCLHRLQVHRQVETIPGGLIVTERFDDKLGAVKIVLEKLKYGPARWTPLVKTVVRESPSPWKAQKILEWLLKHDYIEHPERVYNITEMGSNLLKSIN
jgi:hypothetical protein